MDKPHLPTINERRSGSPNMQRQFALQCLHVKHLRRLSEARANADTHTQRASERDAEAKGGK
jgi:hypothetical protein